jgi:hypothetical protein
MPATPKPTPKATPRTQTPTKQESIKNKKPSLRLRNNLRNSQDTFDAIETQNNEFLKNLRNDEEFSIN